MSRYPNLPGPKSRWLGADFGPKPLKRPGPGTPGPGGDPGGAFPNTTAAPADVRMQRFTGAYRSGWSLRQTTSSGAALKIEL